MAIPDVGDFSDLHEHVLRFMGAFSSTQFAIDGVIGLYLQRRMPDLGLRCNRSSFERFVMISDCLCSRPSLPKPAMKAISATSSRSTCAPSK